MFNLVRLNPMQKSEECSDEQVARKSCVMSTRARIEILKHHVVPLKSSYVKPALNNKSKPKKDEEVRRGTGAATRNFLQILPHA